MNYYVFVRNWWKPNPQWPDGREPEAGPKRVIAKNVTRDEAQQIAKKYNATHTPGPMSRKAEFDEVTL